MLSCFVLNMTHAFKLPVLQPFIFIIGFLIAHLKGALSDTAIFYFYGYQSEDFVDWTEKSNLVLCIQSVHLLHQLGMGSVSQSLIVVLWLNPLHFSLIVYLILFCFSIVHHILFKQKTVFPEAKLIMTQWFFRQDIHECLKKIFCDMYAIRMAMNIIFQVFHMLALSIKHLLSICKN